MKKARDSVQRFRRVHPELEWMSDETVESEIRRINRNRQRIYREFEKRNRV